MGKKEEPIYDEDYHEKIRDLADRCTDYDEGYSFEFSPAEKGKHKCSVISFGSKEQILVKNFLDVENHILQTMGDELEESIELILVGGEISDEDPNAQYLSKMVDDARLFAEGDLVGMAQREWDNYQDELSKKKTSTKKKVSTKKKTSVKKKAPTKKKATPKKKAVAKKKAPTKKKVAAKKKK